MLIIIIKLIIQQQPLKITTIMVHCQFKAVKIISHNTDLQLIILPRALTIITIMNTE